MSIVNSNVSITGHVEKYIGTAYDTVKFVADNMEALLALSELENLDEIVKAIVGSTLLAVASATAAKNSEEAAEIYAAGALASKDAALISETNAAFSADAAATSEANAKASENTAANAAVAAELSAGEAEVSAQDAASSASSASTSRNQAEDWAQEAEDVPVDDSVNPSGFSAYHWAQKAADVITGGESNTASSAGTGVGLVLPKAVADLPFKSILVTGGGSVADTGDTITIDIDEVSDHNDLLNRNVANAHDVPSITGLQAALDAKADLESPVFTGEPRGPTPTVGDVSARLATTQFIGNSLDDKASKEYAEQQFIMAVALS